MAQPTPTDAGPSRVFLLDDHQMFAASLVRVLNDEPDLEVVGTAATIDEAVARSPAARPDVVIVDFLLPDGDGPQAIEALRIAVPTAKVLVLTALNDERTLAAALAAGCDGFVSKDQPPEELLDALRALRRGEAVLPAQLLTRALPLLRRGDDHTALTRRELDVLRLLADGFSNPDIAARLHISVNTVRNHVQSLLTKLDAHSRLEAVAIAVRRGLVTPSRRPPS